MPDDINSSWRTGAKNAHLGRPANSQELATMTRLICEVMQWHADPDSPEYNECDKSKCKWCEDAARLLNE